MSLLKMDIAQNKLTTSISEMNSNKKFLLEHLIEAAALSYSGKVKHELRVTIQIYELRFQIHDLRVQTHEI